MPYIVMGMGSLAWQLPGTRWQNWQSIWLWGYAMKRIALILAIIGCGSRLAWSDDWPMWGRDQTRNMVSPEKNAPTEWQVEVRDRDGKIVKPGRNIKWSAELGTRSMFSPVVSNGLVWVATNNELPRDLRHKGDASVLMCFRENDGKFLWQYVSPRLPSGQLNDWPRSCIGGPLVEGDRLWLITNRCEALGLDIAPLRAGKAEGNVIWKVDMKKEYGVFRHNGGMGEGLACASVALYKDRVFVPTGNGVDEGHVNVPAPDAPSLICFNKEKGKELWKENSPGKGILHEQCATPLVVEVGGKAQVVMPHGDGWLRSFDVETGKLIWKCDANPKDTSYEIGGRGTKSYFMATPVWHGGRIYIATGQDPEHYDGVGWLLCIDPTKQGDISFELDDKPGKGKPNPNSGVVWRYGGPTTKEDQARLDRDYYYGRTLSNCVVHDGLVYATEIAGYLHCLDARSGKAHWVHDLKAAPWGSPLWVDGKIYLPTEDGDVWIFTHGKDKKEPKKIEMNTSIRSSPIFANGVLYIATESRLYAIQEKK
jgi:outer membrane protein assembly factor BamB